MTDSKELRRCYNAIVLNPEKEILE